MNTEIKLHREYIENRLKKRLNDTERASLLNYHANRVRDFQHERLVHLLVTFFFGFLLIVTLAIWLFLPYEQLLIPLSFMLLILFVLEIAYIRHYYLLENGVQSLYELTDQMKEKF